MKQKYFRAIIFLGLTGLIAGSLFANIYCSDNVGEWGVFSYTFLEKMKNVSLNGEKLFGYVFWERVKTWLLLGLLSLTGVGCLMKYLYVIFFGFASGITCSTAVMEHGLKGTLYYLVLALAAQLIFLLAVLAVMEAGQIIHNKSKGDQSKIKIVPVIIIISLLFLIISSLVETIFNINFVKILS